MRVDVAVGEHPLDGRHDALEAALAGVAGGVDDVRLEEDISVRNVAAEVDARSRCRRRVAMERVAQPLIDIDHQGVFLARVEILGLDENGGQNAAVGVRVGDELGLAPDEFGLLRVGGAQFPRAPETGVALPEVGKFVEPLLGEDIGFGPGGFLEVPEGLVHHDEFFGGAVHGHGDAIKTRGFRPLVGRRKHDRRFRRNRPLLGVEPQIAENDLGAPALAPSDRPGAGAVGFDGPDIIPVIDQGRLVSLQPARDAIGRRFAGDVGLLVVEPHPELGGQVDAAAVGHSEGIPLLVGVLEIEEVLPPRRKRRPVGGFLQDLFPRAVRQVDEVVVAVSSVP